MCERRKWPSLEASYKERSWQKTLTSSHLTHQQFKRKDPNSGEETMSKWILTGFCHYILFDGRQPQKHPKTRLGEMLLLRVRLEPHTGHQTLTNARLSKRFAKPGHAVTKWALVIQSPGHQETHSSFKSSKEKLEKFLQWEAMTAPLCG